MAKFLYVCLLLAVLMGAHAQETPAAQPDCESGCEEMADTVDDAPDVLAYEEEDDGLEDRIKTVTKRLAEIATCAANLAGHNDELNDLKKRLFAKEAIAKSDEIADKMDIERETIDKVRTISRAVSAHLDALNNAKKDIATKMTLGEKAVQSAKDALKSPPPAPLAQPIVKTAVVHSLANELKHLHSKMENDMTTAHAVQLDVIKNSVADEGMNTDLYYKSVFVPTDENGNPIHSVTDIADAEAKGLRTGVNVASSTKNTNMMSALHGDNPEDWGKFKSKRAHSGKVKKELDSLKKAVKMLKNVE